MISVWLYRSEPQAQVMQISSHRGRYLFSSSAQLSRSYLTSKATSPWRFQSWTAPAKYITTSRTIDHDHTTSEMKFNRTGLRLLFSIQAGRHFSKGNWAYRCRAYTPKARYTGSVSRFTLYVFFVVEFFLLSSISPDRVPCLASNENPNLTRDNEASRLSGGLLKGTAQDEDCSTRRPPKRKVSQTHLEASWFNSCAVGKTPKSSVPLI